jgi:hypothetical protein
LLVIVFEFLEILGRKIVLDMIFFICLTKIRNIPPEISSVGTGEACKYIYPFSLSTVLGRKAAPILQRGPRCGGPKPCKQALSLRDSLRELRRAEIAVEI